MSKKFVYESLGTFAPDAVGVFDAKAVGEPKNTTDRFCVECGLLVFGQAKEQPKACPHGGCKAPILFRHSQFDEESRWGRCRRCDSFMHRYMSFCQSCGTASKVGIERKRRLDTISRKKLVEEAKRAKKEAEAAKKLQEDPEFLQWKQWKAEKNAQEEREMAAAAELLEKEGLAEMGTSADSHMKQGGSGEVADQPSDSDMKDVTSDK